MLGNMGLLVRFNSILIAPKVLTALLAFLNFEL
ncbi:hypothetical protein OMCYN_01444 [cyanobiont of Ornithocercus magnificus]|nr:hypothetical protein OMCYN_01444 [cyanobiont of Ornithocercus magnificus]